jgi:tRNA G18 (ribose-2'-O)-methylase SpoU
MLSKKKFLTLTEKRQHKHASLLLIKIIDKDLSFTPLYREYEQVLSLPPTSFEEKPLLDRLFLHQERANIPYSMQYTISKEDSISDTPLLPVDIYLENFRSMHNIGAIIRTVEAFRLGEIFITSPLPEKALEKIRKTAMGAEKIIRLKQGTLKDLKRPLIGIETQKDAKSCNDYTFPTSFSLLFGNEQYGLSDEAIEACDEIIQIPLYGNKNSINVSSAFAILANCIRGR